MTPGSQQHARVFELFQSALEQPAEQRRAFLAQASHGDSWLLAEVRALLLIDAELDAAVLSSAMTPEAWQLIEKVFHAARLREPSARLACIDTACPDEPELRQLLQCMLGYQRGADGLLASTAATAYLDRLPNKSWRWSEDTQVGSYAILQPVERDCAGQVYEARDMRSERLVGLRALRPDFAARFKEEGRTILDLNHPNIGTLLDLGRHKGIDYLVTELVAGETLAQRLKGGPLPLQDLLQLGVELCDALHYTHRNGVVHRDLNPKNILTSGSGSKLMDFGVVKTTEVQPAIAERTLTAMGVVLGMGVYMSPEQVLGRGVDERSDIFSVGSILYEMACGESAFKGPSLYDSLVALLTESPRSLTGGGPRLGGGLEPIILRCLAKRPEDRFGDIRALQSALRALTAESRVSHIGPYKILAELGRGMMGIVYRAEDPDIRREVAIKVIQIRSSPDTAERTALRERFLREARAAGSLSHPGIVTVHHLGEHEGQPYIVMELIDGDSMDRYMRSSASHRPQREALVNGLRTVARALDYAHSRSIIHRDIKPTNIFVSKAGIFKVGDFGVAKMLKESDSLTEHGLIGAPLYWAPELLGGSPASARSDQYALGVTAYQVVTLRYPYSADSTAQLLHQIVSVDPPPASSLNGDLHPAVDPILQRVLSKDPSQRFKDCHEFANALYQAVKLAAPPPKPSPPEPPNSPPSASPPRPRPRWVVPALVALPVAAAIGLIAWLGSVRLGSAGNSALWSVHNASFPIIRLMSEPAPYVDGLPPVVENAPRPQLPTDAGDSIGPRNPHVVWKAVQAAYDVHLAGIGGDGTTYLNSYGEIWAVREGRLEWGYSGIEPTRDEYPLPRLQMSLDGRVWFAFGFAFNRNGQGGRLRGVFHPLPSLKMPPFRAYEAAEPRPRYQCVGSFENAQWHAAGPGMEGRDDQGNRWFLPLDHDCQQVQLARNGDLYASTATKTLYRIDTSGRVLWTYRAACTSPFLRSLPSGAVVVACVGEPVQCVRDGRLLWTFTHGTVRQDLHGHPDQPGIEVDKAGTTYFSDWSLERAAQFYALDNEGKLKWRLKLGDIHVDELQFDKAGRIYVSGDGFNGDDRGGSMICLSD